jgi:very-short-patch-repair endonuclease
MNEVKNFIEQLETGHAIIVHPTDLNNINWNTTLTIECRIHGSIKTTPYVLSVTKAKKLCYRCDKNSNTSEYGFSDFINFLLTNYGNKFDTTKMEYNGNTSRAKICCIKHGCFYKIPKQLKANKPNYICDKCKLEDQQKDFIERARKIHNDFYRYDLVEFKGYTKKVKIICPVHGIFEQRAENHLKGDRCLKCVYDGYKMDFEDFLKKAKEKYGNKYDYSMTNYINANTKIKIRCKKHKLVFEAYPRSHISDSYTEGICPLCQGEERTKKFIERAKEVHGDYYDYRLVDLTYITSCQKVPIICPRHGIFFQSMDHHINGGHGCPVCNSHSKIEKKLYEYFQKLGIDFMYQYSLPECSNKRCKRYKYDFYFTEHRLLLEIDDPGHFQENEIYRRRNDRIKNKLATNYGYNLLRIPIKEYTEETFKKIISILEKEAIIPKF